MQSYAIFFNFSSLFLCSYLLGCVEGELGVWLLVMEYRNTSYLKPWAGDLNAICMLEKKEKERRKKHQSKQFREAASLSSVSDHKSALQECERQ